MLAKLNLFGFQALWSPYLLFFLLLLGFCYYYFLIVTGEKNGIAVSKRQIVLFYFALILLYILKGSPVDLLGHLNFSVHMGQMALLYLFVIPLLMVSLPSILFDRIVSITWIKPIGTIFINPIIALLFFNALFSFYHFPNIFDTVKTNVFLHSLFTVLLSLAAFFMWWPLLHSGKRMNKITNVQKMGYIFAAGVLLTPACALIIFSGTPLYLTYTDPTYWSKALQLCVPISQLNSLNLTGPQLFSWLAPLRDQQLGGIVMKVVQEIIYGYMLGFIFFKWVKEERENDQTVQMMEVKYPK